MAKPQRQWAIAIHHNGTVSRWWSGSGQITLNGDTYEGTFVKAPDGSEGSAISLDAPENIAGEVGNRCRFSIAVTDETIRRAVSVDLGPVECEIYWIYPEITTTPVGPFESAYNYFLPSRAQSIPTNTVAAEAVRVVSSDWNPTQGLQLSGRWNFRGTGSTQSGNTGPGSNNILDYIYYETSQSGYVDSSGHSLLTLDGGTDTTPAVNQWLLSGDERQLRLTVSLQGTMFNSPTNGLWVWTSATDPNFDPDSTILAGRQVRALYRTRIPGWAYDNNYAQGQTITDYAGNSFISSYNGGWRNVEIPIPAGHRHVGLSLNVETVPSGSANFTGDAAIAGISFESRAPSITSQWSIADQFLGNLSAPTINVKNAVYSADVEGEFGRYGRGRLKKWSNTNQLADYPGDLCFENVELIERGQARIRW